MKSVNILGISAFYHDASACIVRDGRIIAAAQEERFTRKKFDADFPIEAIGYCLKEAEISADELDHIVFYDKPILKFDRILASYIHTAPKGIRSFLMGVPLWLKNKLWVEDTIQKALKVKKDILFTEHHQSHAASAFYPSPFQEAAIVTVDGAGEWTTTTIGVGEGNRLRLLKKIEFPHSIGLVYSAFTYYCGFRVNSGEYKLMGLAPYGKPIYADLIKKEVIRIEPDGSYILNEKYFNYISGMKMISRGFDRLFGKPALPPDCKPDQFYMDVAASIQAVTDELLVLIAREAYRLTGKTKLCMAGGVALNCVSNGKILKQTPFTDVWIQPAAGDAGGALGAAMMAYYSYLDNKRTADDKQDAQQGSFLGPQYTDEEIELELKSLNAVYEHTSQEQMIKRTAQAVFDQKVIGFFQGRMEYGPRALGNRSIIGDARSTQMQSIMNLKIKFRESFRPFAPAILEERVSEYFEFDRPSPYMLFVADVKSDKRLKADTKGLQGLELLKQQRSTIPAVTHIDYSARLQTVSKKTNPIFYAVIEAFDKLSDCPVVINTSFNVRGEPIACSPTDAYRCFMGSNIDMLVVGNFILYKENQPKDVELSQWRKKLIKD